MYFKKCSTYLTTKKVQMQSTLRFHLTPVRIAKIKEINENKCCQGVGKEDPLFTAGRSTNWYSSMKINVEVAPQLEVEPRSVPGLYSKSSVPYYRDTCSSVCISAQFIVPRKWKKPTYLSVNKSIMKMWCISIQKIH